MTESTIDIPNGTILWLPFPEPVYTLNMNNRIKISADTRNGNYILIFLLVDWKDGKEVETELRRMVFPDKAAIVQFKESFLGAFTEQGL